MANKYVDHSATYDGDGTAPTQAAGAGQPGAYNTLAGKTFSASDVVWLRRKDKVYGATLTLQTANIVYVRWPINGDDYYASRPAAGIAAGWDSDSDQFATIKFTALAYYLLVQTAAGQEFHGIKAWNSFSGSGGNTYAWHVYQADATIKRCYGLSEQAQTGYNGMGFKVEKCSAKFYNCTGETKSHGCTVGTGFWLYGAEGTPECYDCTGINTNATGTGTAFNIQNSALLVRCTAQGYGKAFYVQDIQNGEVMMIDCVGIATTDYGLEIRNGQVRTRNLDLQSGKGYYNYTANGHLHHIKRLTQTAGAVAGIIANSPTLLHAENVTFAANTTSDIITAPGSLIILRNAAFNGGSPAPITGTCDPGVFSFDHQGVVGAFKHWGPRGTVESSAVARVGSSATALKAQVTDASAPQWEPMLQVGLDSIYLPAGAHTVTVFIAYKSYSGAVPDKNTCFFEFEYLDEAAGAHRALATSRVTSGGAFASDASSWSGDTGLTVRKLTASVNALQAGRVMVRAFLNEYDAAGILYIDPKPIVS